MPKNFAFTPSDLNNNVMSLHIMKCRINSIYVPHPNGGERFQALSQRPSGIEGAIISLAFSLKKCTTKQHTTEKRHVQFILSQRRKKCSLFSLENVPATLVKKRLIENDL